MAAKIFLLLFLLAIAASVANEITPNDDIEPHQLSLAKVRTKRGIFWDFFQKLVTTKNLAVDQYTDTRNTLNEVYNLVNEGFSDPAPAKPTSRPKVVESSTSSSSEEETTTEAFRVSRYELGRILGRNFRGLQRLTKIEFQDAFNQSNYNLREYKAEADKQFANSLALEKKNQLKRLKG